MTEEQERRDQERREDDRRVWAKLNEIARAVAQLEITAGPMSRENLRAVMAEHLNTCPMHDRVNVIELKLSRFVGWMSGAGAVGGIAAGLLLKMVGL